MASANELRGEVSLVLDGTSFVLRPSYEALVAIERQTECSLSILQLSAVTKTLSVENTGIIAAECIKAQGRAVGDADMQAVSAGKLGRLIVDAGLQATFPLIAQLMTGAISGGYTATGEVKPGTLAA